MAGTDSRKGLYDHLYQRFYERRNTHEGYDFQHAPGGSVQPPVVKFRDKLKWWTWDRWQRRKQILRERDRQQQEIINMKGRS
ncbi:hypothetical protein W02_14400 [Nitrospira sp. KM1]|uniref:hypothetical protein n=1 Tax=Nitrospira sp. KM1 TaxID=1936990 RepID=UPI0013A714CB|nr:hypothetical protein [Nitrospira sp. KM1]BCA54300.1 hypothetical protein W02_14400 [Nitrospira sp. KM1]